MAWYWTDDLARLVIEHDGVDPGRLTNWLATPSAYRSDLEPLAFARELFDLPRPDVVGDDAASSAA